MHTHPERDTRRQVPDLPMKQRHRQKTHTYSYIHREAHREKRHTQTPKIHGDADRRIHKQRYSDTSTRRGRSQTPTPTANTEGPRREDTPGDPITQRENHAQRHTNRRHQEHKNTHKKIHPASGTHTQTHPLCMGACAALPEAAESAPQSSQNHLGAPRRALQPTSAGEDFAAASLNKGPPAVGLRRSLRVRPLGLCAAATRPRRPRPSSRVPGWRCGPRAAPCGASPLPARSPRPARPPEPGTEHPQVLSSLLVPLGGKLSPGWSRRRAARPSPTPGGTALGAPTCAHAAVRSRRLQQVSHRARTALLSRGRRRCSRSLPSRYPGNRLLLPPANQPAPFTWRLTANGRPRHSGPLPGSRAPSQAKGPDGEAGVTLELLRLEDGVPGARESHLVSPLVPFCGTDLPGTLM